MDSGPKKIEDVSKLPLWKISQTITMHMTGRTIKNPRENDVLFGRGAPFIRWKGNIAFREIVHQRKGEYHSTRRHADKNIIAREIIDFIRDEQNGRFLIRASAMNADVESSSPHSSSWTVAEDRIILEKVKQTLRTKHLGAKHGSTPTTGKSGATKSSSSSILQTEDSSPIDCASKTRAKSPTPGVADPSSAAVATADRLFQEEAKQTIRNAQDSRKQKGTITSVVSRTTKNTEVDCPSVQNEGSAHRVSTDPTTNDTSYASLQGQEETDELDYVSRPLDRERRASHRIFPHNSGDTTIQQPSSFNVAGVQQLLFPLQYVADLEQLRLFHETGLRGVGTRPGYQHYQVAPGNVDPGTLLSETPLSQLLQSIDTPQIHDARVNSCAERRIQPQQGLGSFDRQLASSFEQLRSRPGQIQQDILLLLRSSVNNRQVRGAETFNTAGRTRGTGLAVSSTSRCIAPLDQYRIVDQALQSRRRQEYEQLQRQLAIESMMGLYFARD